MLADSGYGITPYLMVPFTQAQSAADPVKRRYNYILSRDRVVIENTIGQLKCRFQMLRVPLRIHLEQAPKLILAGCILHNVGEFLNDTFEDDPDYHDDDNEDEDDDGQALPTGATAVRIAGQNKRDQISAIL